MEQLLARHRHRKATPRKLGSTWAGATPFLRNCRTGWAVLVAPAHVPCEDQRSSERVLTACEVGPRLKFEGGNG